MGLMRHTAAGYRHVSHTAGSKALPASTSPLAPHSAHQEISLLPFPLDQHLKQVKGLQYILTDHPQLVQGVLVVLPSAPRLGTVHPFPRSASEGGEGCVGAGDHAG